MGKSFYLLLSLCLAGWCRGNAVTVHKDIDYVDPSVPGYDEVRHKLDIYEPEEGEASGKVMVFIHGGSWDSGHKETYRFLGKAFAKNGITTVVINYRLSPEVGYKDMAWDCARAVAWVYHHVHVYGGSNQHLFLAGHSAGGHLAALLTTDHSFLEKAGIAGAVEGCVLNDPFGLDIYSYLHHGYKGDETFRRTFTNDPEVWKAASPLRLLQATTVKYYMLYGGHTYPAVSGDSQAFHARNVQLGNRSQIHAVGHKKHIGMVLQFFRKNNREVKKVVAFMEE